MEKEVYKLHRSCHKNIGTLFLPMCLPLQMFPFLFETLHHLGISILNPVKNLHWIWKNEFWKGVIGCAHCSGSVIVKSLGYIQTNWYAEGVWLIYWGCVTCNWSYLKDKSIWISHSLFKDIIVNLSQRLYGFQMELPNLSRCFHVIQCLTGR